MKKRAEFEPLRSLAFGSISATYAAVGSPTTAQTRIICITNNTEGDMIFSRDPDVAAGQFFLPAGSFKLFDISGNARFTNQDDLTLSQNTQWYVKQSTAPVSGSVYIECIYAT